MDLTQPKYLHQLQPLFAHALSTYPDRSPLNLSELGARTVARIYYTPPLSCCNITDVTLSTHAIIDTSTSEELPTIGNHRRYSIGAGDLFKKSAKTTTPSSL
ncbi:hypothetical protein BC936DRAFT_149842 [Jimgerdemannia flammicorona]|uniref:Uncharacterized protein n=1 Tax=Jimgerdemannia flammicorona TaxID=994334 RepID=A0A433D013_9FUNG|nr:hypothetical protein BC936DRAFT_149842 [Jimgerdemannia flammicorona]